jgi:hypothetical protein
VPRRAPERQVLADVPERLEADDIAWVFGERRAVERAGDAEQVPSPSRAAAGGRASKVTSLDP